MHFQPIQKTQISKRFRGSMPGPDPPKGFDQDIVLAYTLLMAATLCWWAPGPSCIKHFLRLRGNFLHPFPVFRRILLYAIMDKSAEGGLKSIGNKVTVRKNPPENREQLQKFSLNLEFLYATVPRLSGF